MRRFHILAAAAAGVLLLAAGCAGEPEADMAPQLGSSTVFDYWKDSPRTETRDYVTDGEIRKSDFGITVDPDSAKIPKEGGSVDFTVDAYHTETGTEIHQPQKRTVPGRIPVYRNADGSFTEGTWEQNGTAGAWMNDGAATTQEKTATVVHGDDFEIPASYDSSWITVSGSGTTRRAVVSKTDLAVERKSSITIRRTDDKMKNTSLVITQDPDASSMEINPWIVVN